jgi:hypothetical protein
MTNENKKNDYTFELNSDGNILWKGHMRFKFIGAESRHYKAYEEYCKDTEVADRLNFSEFNSRLYQFDGDDLNALAQKYKHLKFEEDRFITYLSLEDFVLTLKKGMDMGVISEEFKGMIIDGFKTSVEVNFQNHEYWLDKDKVKEITIICKK